MNLSLEGKSILVLGLGVSGSSAAHYLLAKGSNVWIYDDKLASMRDQLQVKELLNLGAFEYNLNNLNTIDLVIVSPGIPQTHFLYSAAVKAGLPLMGESELALRELSKEYRCIGITGTNGKTTVTYLIEHILNANGVHAKALGNSGIPLTSFLMAAKSRPDPISVIVAELSSFQLETMRSRVFDAAILLNITLDHLERYPSFSHYAEAKAGLFDCLKESGAGYIQYDCAQGFVKMLEKYSLKTYGFENSATLYTDGKAVFYEETTLGILPEPFKNSKSHDIENILAAFAMTTALHVDADGIMNSLISFKKPPHRLELVGEINGIQYIDDSKATNTDAVMRAVQSITGPIILIAGGVDKGGSYKVWIPYFQDKVRVICTIGQASDKIYQDLCHCMPIYSFKSLLDAVTYASLQARSGDTVLLSPGCSSYDMFTSYVHRGKHFQEIVQALITKGEL